MDRIRNTMRSVLILGMCQVRVWMTYWILFPFQKITSQWLMLLKRYRQEENEYIVVPAHPIHTPPWHQDEILHILQDEFQGYHDRISFPGQDTTKPDANLPQSLLLFEVKKNSGRIDNDPHGAGTRTPTSSSGNDCTYVPIGHVAISRSQARPNKESDETSARKKAQIQKLLQAGVPRASVELSARMQYGIEDLDAFLLATNTSDDDEIEAPSSIAVSIGALVVTPLYRGRGLGKALAKMAVAWSVHIAKADEVSAWARNEHLLQWYARLGATLDRTSSSTIVHKTYATKNKSISLDIQSLKKASSLDEEDAMETCVRDTLQVPTNISFVSSADSI